MNLITIGIQNINPLQIPLFNYYVFFKRDLSHSVYQKNSLSKSLSFSLAKEKDDSDLTLNHSRRLLNTESVFSRLA